MKKCFAACLIILTLLGARGNLFSQKSASHTITIRVLPVRSIIVLPRIQYFKEMSKGGELSYNIISNKVTVSVLRTSVLRLSDEEQPSRMFFARDFKNFSDSKIANMEKNKGVKIPVLFTLLDNN